MVKLFAGGFPRDLEDIELKEIFEQFGTVEAVNIVRDKHTGISRRFGFVDMTDEEGAANAIANLHEASVDDDTISVTIADERQKEKEETKKQLAAQKAQMKAKPVRINTQQRPKGGRPFQKPYNNNRNNNSNGNSGYGRSNNYGGNNNYNNHNNGNNNSGGYRDYNNSSSYNNSTSGEVSYTKVVRPGEGNSNTGGRRPRKRM